MDETSEFTSVLKLVDDDHPAVREAVKQKLGLWADQIDDLLEQHAPDAPAHIRSRARHLSREFVQDEFIKAWEAWIVRSPSDHQKLEDGLCLLANYLTPAREHPVMVSEELDALAEEFLRQFPEPNFRDLIGYLFGSDLFRGNEEDFYAPDNSNFARVLRDRTGNPISLACLFILVGQRCDLSIGGCNYPTHFLAQCWDENLDLLLVDCFNGGQTFPVEELITSIPLPRPTDLSELETPASPELIISRCLRNLDTAFQRTGDKHEERFVRRLWDCMSHHEG